MQNPNKTKNKKKEKQPYIFASIKILFKVELEEFMNIKERF